jgi:hypothetical protein
MAGIERFEEIEAWQAARELMRRVYPPSQKTTAANAER